MRRAGRGTRVAGRTGGSERLGLSPVVDMKTSAHDSTSRREVGEHRRRLVGRVIALVSGAALLLSCGGTVDIEMQLGRDDAPLTDPQWQRLATLKVFFGHQSVGRNIVAGIDEIVRDERPRVAPTVLAAASPRDVAGPALVHGEIGRNGDPRSKTAAFLAALDGVSADRQPDVAMYKFCYVDVDDTTDVDALFADYRAGVAAVRARHPSIRLVHVTIPLTAVSQPNAVKAAVKRLLGRSPSSELEREARRNRFNALLRSAYGATEPVFDLARVESTHGDGSRSFFLRGRDTVYTLASEYTEDGGHLNALGRRRAAGDLLRLISDL